MKQTLADLAIRLGLPQVVRVEKGREEVIQPTTVVYSGSNLEPPLAAPEMMHSSVCLLQNRRSAGVFLQDLIVMSENYRNVLKLTGYCI